MRALSGSLVLVAFIVFTVTVRAQVENQSAMAAIGRTSMFSFDALNFAQYDEFGITGRMDIYVQVPMDVIKFLKKDDGYIANYTLSVLINNEEGTLVKEESWSRTIDVKTFDATVQPGSSDITQRSISVDPGSYNFEVVLEDKVSGKEYRQSKKFVVKKWDRNVFDVSDIMLATNVVVREGKRHVTPQIHPNLVGLEKGFYLLYELYNPYDINSVRLSYRVKKRYEMAINQTDKQTIKRGANSFLANISTANLGVGTYTLDLTVTRLDDTTETGVLAHTTKQFIIEWLSTGSPFSIVDLDEAIEQMKYFASSDDLDSIKSARDDKEKKKRFEEYWERRNPTPGSKFNRAMVEYYKRVAYANENFKHYIDGWKTDRGMVYVIYGAPSAVDRHPMDVESKPYEVWEYYDISKRFVFIDESGFGDYRLLYPLWDERNRLR
jgi:GWxTD domain-containing protein